MKRKIGFAGIAVVSGLALSAVAYATVTWGPARTAFSINHPATYITFNSYTDNPVWGDERQFIEAKGVTEPSSAYKKSVPVTDGQQYKVQVYFHNNAASNLNLVAQNVRARVALPSNESTVQDVSAFISASNANPTEVFSTMEFTSSKAFSLQYVPGSASLRTNYVTTALSDALVSGGTPIGTNGANGQVPGCLQYSGYVEFVVKVKEHVTPPPTPQYQCDLLSVDVLANRKVNASVDYTALNGAVFNGVNFAWGDGNVTNTANDSASHTYGKDGKYTIKATAKFTLPNGRSVSDTSAACQKTVDVTTPTPPQPPKPQKGPTQLPNTGAGSVAGIFAGVSTLAGVGHYIVRRARS